MGAAISSGLAARPRGMTEKMALLVFGLCSAVADMSVSTHPGATEITYMAWRAYSVDRDQNIKPPKTLNGSFDQFLRCSSAGKIAVDGRTVLFPQFFDQPFRLRLGFFVIEHDASPSRHEHPDRRRANAA